MAKTCPSCAQEKNDAQFYKNTPHKATGHVSLSGWCRECHLQNRYRYRYGMSVEQREAQFVLQEGKCAICSTAISLAGRPYTHVDHDHTTGAWRGLLCGHCNQGLGHFKDSVDLMARAIQYLREGGVWEHK